MSSTSISLSLELPGHQLQVCSALKKTSPARVGGDRFGWRIMGQTTARFEAAQMGAYGRPRLYVRQTIAEVLELFPGLKRHTGSMAAALSGGEQQMLAIGRALMSKPRLILLDEPSLGLAPMLVDQVFSTLQEINRAGTSILLVEQNAAYERTGERSRLSF